MTDSRPRVKYVFPDGRIATLILDHGQRPRPLVDCQVSADDPLWSSSQRRPGTASRFTHLALVQGQDPACRCSACLGGEVFRV